ncbi:Branched-chain-amino-acid aminotransferase [bacterium HR36]|nr:Branched-chain-amino-acid aminotransferase [bacterium HR36]
MVRDWAWLNGQWIPAQDLAIPVWDAGFVFGATVTDLCRTIGHRLFRCSEHVRRFFASAQLCDIPLAYTETELTKVAEELVARQIARLSAWEDLAVVIFATPGSVAQYRPISASPDVADQEQRASRRQEGVGNFLDDSPTLGLHTFRLPLERYARLWRTGFRLIRVGQAPEDHIFPRQAKHRSRLYWWRAQRQVERQQPGAIALLCDRDGALLETAFANLVLVFGETLATPSLDRVLHGVSLQVVAELADALGCKWQPQNIYPDAVMHAEEAFLTSSSFCLLPVQQIDGKKFRCPGPMAQQLLRAWSELASFDLLAQLAAHDR